MKTAKDWMQIHGENAFYANGVLSESDIEQIQLDACQSQAERILEIIASSGIDVTDCDGDDDPAIILADWIVRRINELHAAEERHANLVNGF